MDLIYEHGDGASPKGHALLYFQSSDGGALYATYVVVLPVALDVGKYMPPFLASQLGQVTAQEVSAFAFPPMPEESGGHDQLLSLAAVRGDDLLFGGVIAPQSDAIQSTLLRVNEVVQQYAQQYRAHIETAVHVDAAAPEGIGGHAVNEVLFQLMGERDRLGELAKLAGQLRFAVEGADARQVQEAEEEVAVLARYLPERYRVEALVRAAKDPARGGGDLAQLYLERCYKLADEDYERLQEIEARIRTLEGAG